MCVMNSEVGVGTKQNMISCQYVDVDPFFADLPDACQHAAAPATTRG